MKTLALISMLDLIMLTILQVMTCVNPNLTQETSYDVPFTINDAIELSDVTEHGDSLEITVDKESSVYSQAGSFLKHDVKRSTSSSTRSSSSSSSGDGCYDEESFWHFFTEGFDATSYDDGSVEYTEMAHMLGPVLPGRKKRQLNVYGDCTQFNSYAMSQNVDGDSCCNTRRTTCLWHAPIVQEGAELFPVWRASVTQPPGMNKTITIRFQYWYDILCSRSPGCPQCRKIAHERQVLVTSTPPTELNIDRVGDYGHPYVNISDVRFYNYQEATYCYCIR